MQKVMQESPALRQEHFSLLHFVQLQRIVYSSVIDLIPLIGIKIACIFLKPRVVELSTIDLCRCNNVTI